MWVKLCVNRLCKLRNSLSEQCPPSLSPQSMNSSGVHSYTNKQTRELRDMNWPRASARMSFFCKSEDLKSGLLVHQKSLIMVLHSVKFLPGLPKWQLHFKARKRGNSKASIWSYDKCLIAGLSVMKCFVIHSHAKRSRFLVKNDIQGLSFVLNQSVCRSRRDSFIMLKNEILWNILKSRCKGFFNFFFLLSGLPKYQ